jgi:uncharacterized protein YbcI
MAGHPSSSQRTPDEAIGGRDLLAILAVKESLRKALHSRDTCVCAERRQCGGAQDAGLAGGFYPPPSYLSRVPIRREARKGAGMPGTDGDRLKAASVSSAISKAAVALLSDYTGRGPTRARTYINEDLIIVVLYDTLTSEERAIVRSGAADLVLSARQAFQKAMRPELTATVERFSGRSTSACMGHNHLDPDIVVESFLLAPRTNGAPVDGP